MHFNIIFSIGLISAICLISQPVLAAYNDDSSIRIVHGNRRTVKRYIAPNNPKAPIGSRERIVLSNRALKFTIKERDNTPEQEAALAEDIQILNAQTEEEEASDTGLM